MKRFIKIIIVLLLGIMIMPSVHAKQKTLPREGVAYFMHYPDGHEDVTEEYEEAVNPTEKLIYSATTDSNGNVNLCGWENEGTIRVVQHVPDGYTTNLREITIDLSKNTQANFVNYKGLTNPLTGRSILVLLGIAGVVVITILVSRKNKKSLLIIPIVIGMIAIVSVKAEPACSCVTVKDGSGKALSGVQIDIYAEPTEVEAAPAVKFSANGGNFFDGTTVMYFRLPSASCTFQNFLSSLSEEELGYLRDNSSMAYRDGYDIGIGSVISDPITNGTVIKIEWEPNDRSDLIVIDGNGGAIDFYGKKLTSVTAYINNLDPEKVAGLFRNGNLHNIGPDVTPACSNYNDDGTYINPSSEDAGEVLLPIDLIDFEAIQPPVPHEMVSLQRRIAQELYVCWNNNPDGLYVNDTLFQGNDDSCYKEAKFEKLSDDEVALHSWEANKSIYLSEVNAQEIAFSEMVLEKSPISITYEEERTEYYRNTLSPSPEELVRLVKESSEDLQKEEIHSIKIVKNGIKVLEVSADEMEKEAEYYYIEEVEKRNAVMEYLDRLYSDAC